MRSCQCIVELICSVTKVRNSVSIAFLSCIYNCVGDSSATLICRTLSSFATIWIGLDTPLIVYPTCANSSHILSLSFEGAQKIRRLLRKSTRLYCWFSDLSLQVRMNSFATPSKYPLGYAIVSFLFESCGSMLWIDI